MARRHTFNTAIASAMELVNALGRYEAASESARAVRQEALSVIVRVLSPIVPHVTHELWQQLGGEGAVAEADWPEVDESALSADEVELVVQVNGKLRGRIRVPAGADREAIEQAALAEDNVKRHIDGQAVRKVIVVPDKLVNVVI